MRQPTIHQMREKKNHRGKVKEVERLQYKSQGVRSHDLGCQLFGVLQLIILL
jgi:hypothetical protein